MRRWVSDTPVLFPSAFPSSRNPRRSTVFSCRTCIWSGAAARVSESVLQRTHRLPTRGLTAGRCSAVKNRTHRLEARARSAERERERKHVETSREQRTYTHEQTHAQTERHKAKTETATLCMKHWGMSSSAMPLSETTHSGLTRALSESTRQSSAAPDLTHTTRPLSRYSFTASGTSCACAPLAMPRARAVRRKRQRGSKNERKGGRKNERKERKKRKEGRKEGKKKKKEERKRTCMRRRAASKISSETFL
eukprot:2168634-Rhodomonas_salina.3